MATGTPAALAAKAATTTIPVVFAAVGDPVAVGLVPTLARPSGNVTGVSNMRAGLVQKQIELLKEVAPTITRVAVLIDPVPEIAELYSREVQESAQRLGVRVVRITAGTADELESAFAFHARDTHGLVVAPSGTLWVQRLRISALAVNKGLPSIFPWIDAVEAGALMAYTVNDGETYYVAGKYVGRILNGTKPSDLPVEQPTKFTLAINLKAAEVLRLSVPQSLLLRADRVIQ
jgi:putative ABC transport system substrate-binding protein